MAVVAAERVGTPAVLLKKHVPLFSSATAMQGCAAFNAAT